MTSISTAFTNEQVLDRMYNNFVQSLNTHGDSENKPDFSKVTKFIVNFGNGVVTLFVSDTKEYHRQIKSDDLARLKLLQQAGVAKDLDDHLGEITKKMVKLVATFEFVVTMPQETDPTKALNATQSVDGMSLPGSSLPPMMKIVDVFPHPKNDGSNIFLVSIGIFKTSHLFKDKNDSKDNGTGASQTVTQADNGDSKANTNTNANDDVDYKMPELENAGDKNEN